MIIMQGQVLYSKKMNGNEEEINVSEFPKGTYFVVYITDDCIDKEKVIIR